MEKEKRKKNHLPSLLIAFLLFILGLITTVVLFSRILYFSGREVKNVIPLVGTSGSLDKNTGEYHETSGSLELGYNTKTDENGDKVWENTARADIFRCFYDNEQGKITVIADGEGEDRVIAPGTSNDYKFTIQNTTAFPLDYDMYVEAEVIGTEHEIPLRVSLRADNSGYIAGSENSGSIKDLDGVRDSSVLGGGRCNYYTLSWDWPFEQGKDEYDTMLGDLSVKDTITVRVRFKTIARLDADPEDPRKRDAGDKPKTGDDSPYMFLCVMMSAALAVAVFFFLVGGKRTRDDEEDKERS